MRKVEHTYLNFADFDLYIGGETGKLRNLGFRQCKTIIMPLIPISYSSQFLGSCLLWVMSTETSVDIAADIAVDIAVDSRSIVGRQSVDTRSLVGRQSVDSRSILGRQSVDIAVDSQSTVGR